MSNKTLAGKSSDYRVTSIYPGGIVLSGPDYTGPINAGYELHFEGDERDARIVDGRLVFEDGPLGGGSAPDPRVAIIESRYPGLLDRLAN